MNPSGEQLTRLRTLLDRVQKNAAVPRLTRARFVEEEQREPTLPGSQLATAGGTLEFAPVEIPFTPEPPPVVASVEPIVEHHLESAPTLEPVQAEEQPLEPVREEEVHVEPVPVEHVEPFEEPRAEAISGEFAVAEVAPAEMMELEELGPADDLEEHEHVVEIQVDERDVSLTPIVEDGRPIEDLAAEYAPIAAPLEAVPQTEEEEPISEPPTSGRELVATPYESQRLAVAAPATPDPNALELAEEPEPPPESSRNLRVAPAVPTTSDVIELPLARESPAEPTEAPSVSEGVSFEPAEIAPEPIALREGPTEALEEPISAPPPAPSVSEGMPGEERELVAREAIEAPISAPPPAASEPSGAPSVSEGVTFEAPEPIAAREEPTLPPSVAEPQQVAVAVALAHRPTQHVVVAIDADVIHAELTPADVAAFIGAARAPRPETFGVLLDAALDL